MNVIGVIAAMAAEGTVFRKAWKLEALATGGPFRCYGDEDRVLVISGTGMGPVRFRGILAVFPFFRRTGRRPD